MILPSGISPNDFLSALRAHGICFFTGVPDSLLKEFNACLLDSAHSLEHIIASNEGAAIGLALGHYLASGSLPLVYMQNSGLGNSINPLVSLVDPVVMGCPMLLLIGWRGELLEDASQLKDEPQHKLQGRITLSQLHTLGIPYQVLDKYSDPIACLHEAVTSASERRGPVAIVVRKETFAPYLKKDEQRDDLHLINRESAIRAVLDSLPDSLPLIATTGMPSRELFDLRARDGTGHVRDLLCVGGMGHAASIAAGIAVARPQMQVVCLDGDGAMLMHLGALTNTATCSNLIHIVLNNGAHDSVGGQPTRAAELDLSCIAAACGYRRSLRARTPEEIHRHLQVMLEERQSSFLEILCCRGNRTDLGRPTQTPTENREDFMLFLKDK
jgi:phosphonopyruvate decarboxylase